MSDAVSSHPIHVYHKTTIVLDFTLIYALTRASFGSG